MYITFIIFICLLFFVENSLSQQSLSPDEFIEKLSKSKVKKGQVMIFYVEQNTFALKTDRQKIIWIDPFLSRKGIPPSGFFHKEERIDPEKVPADYVFCTHAHLDHTHLATIEIINRKNPKAEFIAPKESFDIFRKANISEDRIRIIKLDDEWSFPGFKVKAVYGEPTDKERTTHLGYVFKIGEIKIYDSGDSKVGLDNYIDKMQSLIIEKPDVALIIINEGYNNLGPKDAAKLASLIKCKLFIPTHFNCFVNNSIDPKSVYPFLPKDSKMEYRIME